MADASQTLETYEPDDSFSLTGWNFKEWLQGNRSTIKEVVKAGIPFLLTYSQTRNLPFFLQFTLIIIGTIAGKLVLDTGHYYIKK